MTGDVRAVVGSTAGGLRDQAIAELSPLGSLLQSVSAARIGAGRRLQGGRAVGAGAELEEGHSSS